MMLAKDNKPVMRLGAHKLYCNKQTSNTSMACTTYGLKSEQVRVGHIVAQCVCPGTATKSVLLIRCAILQQFLHRYIIPWGTMYIAGIATAGGHTMY